MTYDVTCGGFPYSSDPLILLSHIFSKASVTYDIIFRGSYSSDALILLSYIFNKEFNYYAINQLSDFCFHFLMIHIVDVYAQIISSLKSYQPKQCDYNSK